MLKQNFDKRMNKHSKCMVKKQITSYSKLRNWINVHRNIIPESIPSKQQLWFANSFFERAMLTQRATDKGSNWGKCCHVLSESSSDSSTHMLSRSLSWGWYNLSCRRWRSRLRNCYSWLTFKNNIIGNSICRCADTWRYNNWFACLRSRLDVGWRRWVVLCRNKCTLC